MTEPARDPHADENRILAFVAREMINDMVAALGDQASHPFGPYASVWHGMNGQASMPLHIRVAHPMPLIRLLAAANSQNNPAANLAVLGRQALITFLYERQAIAPDRSRGWWQNLIDLATEIADRAAGEQFNWYFNEESRQANIERLDAAPTAS